MSFICAIVLAGSFSDVYFPQKPEQIFREQITQKHNVETLFESISKMLSWSGLLFQKASDWLLEKKDLPEVEESLTLERTPVLKDPLLALQDIVPQKKHNEIPFLKRFQRDLYNKPLLDEIPNG